MLLLVTYFAEPHRDNAIRVWQRKQQQKKRTTNAQFSQYSSETLGNTGGYPMLGEEAPRTASAGDSLLYRYLFSFKSFQMGNITL